MNSFYFCPAIDNTEAKYVFNFKYAYLNFNTKVLIYVGGTERDNVNSSRFYIAIDNIESRIHTIFQVYRFNSFSVICNSYIVKIGPFLWEVLTRHMLIVQILYPAIYNTERKICTIFQVHIYNGIEVILFESKHK